MKRFLVAYELGEDANPLRITALLRSQKSWARPIKRVWLVETDLRASDLRDRLKQAVGEDGKVLVLEVADGAWATSAVGKSVTEWLRQR